MLFLVKREHSHGFSKEYADMKDEKFYDEVLSYMVEWMLCHIKGENIVLFPSVGLFEGIYKD
jgi:hypothetical protein